MNALEAPFFVTPGYICVPAQPTRLGVVAASGIAVTLFDTRRRCGGATHYLRPVRERGHSTPVFAAPAIVRLVEMFLGQGSLKADLEAHLFGGAENPAAPRHEPQLSQKNIEVGVELLEKLGIPLSGQDTGGYRARKIVFHSGTGETVVAKVEQVRQADWYPDVFSGSPA